MIETLGRPEGEDLHCDHEDGWLALPVGGEHDFQSLGGGVVRRVS